MGAAHTNRGALPAVPHHPIPVRDVVIEVRADPANPGGRLVLQDGVESSYIDLRRPDRLGFEYQRHLAGIVDAALPRRRPLRMLQIGGGPCAVPRYLEATRREFACTVVEIDPGVIDVARRYLGLVTSARLGVAIGDGRERLRAVPDGTLDLLVVDAFAGLVVPHRLVTAQFAQDVRRALRPGGLHLVNLIDIPPLGFARAAVATMAGAWAHVLILADPATLSGASSGNLVLAGSDAPLAAEVVARRAARDPDPWETLSGGAPARWAGDAAPLDDAVAPAHELAMLGDLFGRVRRPARPEGVAG